MKDDAAGFPCCFALGLENGHVLTFWFVCSPI